MIEELMNLTNDQLPESVSLTDLTKRNTVIRLNQRGRVEMQMLPSALEWRHRMKRQDVNHNITFQLRSPLAQAFAGAYVWPGGFDTGLPIQDDMDLVNFTVERNGPQTVFQQAEKFFGSVHRDFFHTVGFPLTPLGRMQQLLWKARQPHVGPMSMIFMAMHDPYEYWELAWPTEFWKSIVRRLSEADAPMIAPIALVPAHATRSFSCYGYIDTHRNIHDVWYWTTQLLLSRMYIGVQCFFSQLAYLLGVPSIVIGADESDLLLPSVGPGQLTRPLPATAHSDQVLDAYNEMGRVLLYSR